MKRLAEEEGHDFTVSAHYAAKKGVENVANFLGGCGTGRLYVGLEPNGDIKPCVFFPTNKDTTLGNILEDDFEHIWDNNKLLWKLRTREKLETYEINGQTTGCGNCEDKYICGGCRARAYSYFNGTSFRPVLALSSEWYQSRISWRDLFFTMGSCQRFGRVRVVYD